MDWTRLEQLRAEQRKHETAAREETARAYAIEAEVYRMNGDDVSAEFYAALAASYRNESGAEERFAAANKARLAKLGQATEPQPAA